MTKLLILFVVVTISASSAVITFEGAASGTTPTVDVSPDTPYQEAGFTLTPATSASAIFDSQRLGTVLSGDSTTVFGFSFGNAITLTGPVPFDLNSAVIGRLVNNPARVVTLDVTIVGSLVGGGTSTVTFSNLSNAAQQVIGLHNLQSARFTGTANVGLDDISVTSTVPEPGYLFAFGVLSVTCSSLARRCLRRT